MPFTELSNDWLSRLAGYRQVTDLHLLALTHHQGGQLATFDTKLSGLVSKGAAKGLIEVLGYPPEGWV